MCVPNHDLIERPPVPIWWTNDTLHCTNICLNTLPTEEHIYYPSCILGNRGVQHICTACDAVEEGNEPSCTCWSLLTGIAESNGAQLGSATHWFPRMNVSLSAASLCDIFLHIVTLNPIVATFNPFRNITRAQNEIFGCLKLETANSPTVKTIPHMVVDSQCKI